MSGCFVSSPEAAIDRFNRERGGPRQRLRDHLRIARISNSPTVVSNVLAGAVLATALDWSVEIVCVAIAMVLFYTAGMYLNDILDYEIDRQQRSERPLPSGAIARSEAVVVTVILFVAGFSLLLTAGMRPFLAGIVLMGAIALYDAWHKGNAIGPLIMGSTRVLVYVIAFLTFSSDISWRLVIWSAVMLLYIAGLTSIAKTEHGPSLTRYWPVAALFPAVIVAVGDEPSVWTFAVSAIFVAWVIYCLSFVYVPTKRSIGGAIGRLIAGVSILDALVLASRNANWGVVIAFLCFGLTIFFQRYIRGT
jgi:4-hydroxybenzoate polyprenyltransferase